MFWVLLPYYCIHFIGQAPWWLRKGLVDIDRMCNLVLIIESLLCSGYLLVSINKRPKFPFTLALSEPYIHMPLPKTSLSPIRLCMFQVSG